MAKISLIKNYLLCQKKTTKFNIKSCIGGKNVINNVTGTSDKTVHKW